MLGILVRDSSIPTDPLFTMPCIRANRQDSVKDIVQWTPVSFDLDRCDGITVFIDKSNFDEILADLRNCSDRCIACVVTECEHLHGMDCSSYSFPIYLVSTECASQLKALKGREIEAKLDDSHQPISIMQSEFIIH